MHTIISSSQVSSKSRKTSSFIILGGRGASLSARAGLGGIIAV